MTSILGVVGRKPPPAPNDPNRFQGDGVLFRGKLIGIADVPELKGDKMCFDAMQKLKLDVLHRGEHKPRIFIGVGVEGMKIRKNENDKPEDLWHHHEVKCISFIWRDPTDARAFGYVTALSADTKKQFIAIKTERAADQVIATLKELFQAIIDAKNKENAPQAQAPAADGAATVQEAEVVATRADRQTAAAPPTAAEPAAVPEQAEEGVNLFGDWPAPEAPKKEENFFDMLLAPPTAPEQRSADFTAPAGGAKANDWFGAGAGGFAAPAAPAPAASAWGMPAPSVPPRGAPVNPMGFPSGAANPFFAQPTATSYPGLNMGPGFTSAPAPAPVHVPVGMHAAPAYGNSFGAAPFGAAPFGAAPFAAAPAPMNPASAWGSPAPAAPAPAASLNPFTVERGSAASTAAAAPAGSVFSGAKKETPFFKDLAIAGKELYGMWPEAEAKGAERPKALHELVAARQPQQPQQPQAPQAAPSPFGIDNSFPSASLAPGGSLLD